MVDRLKTSYFFGFSVSLGLHQRNDGFLPATGEFLQNCKLTLPSLCYLLTIKTLTYLNIDTGWGFNDNFITILKITSHNSVFEHVMLLLGSDAAILSFSRKLPEATNLLNACHEDGSFLTFAAKL